MIEKKINNCDCWVENDFLIVKQQNNNIYNVYKRAYKKEKQENYDNDGNLVEVIDTGRMIPTENWAALEKEHRPIGEKPRHQGKTINNFSLVCKCYTSLEDAKRVIITKKRS